MRDMWATLQTITHNQEGQERPVNHLNEWGGFSQRLNMPVFTAWRDHTTYNKEDRTVSAIVSDTQWGSSVGVNNQERWVNFALENGGVAAFFVIHAVDTTAIPRKVESIDTAAVFVGQIVREGTEAKIIGTRQAL